MNNLYNISIVFKKKLDEFYTYSTFLNCSILTSVISRQIFQFPEISMKLNQLSDNSNSNHQLATIDNLYKSFNQINNLILDFYAFVNKLHPKRNLLNELYMKSMDCTAIKNYEEALSEFNAEMELIIDYGKEITILIDSVLYDTLTFVNSKLQNDLNTGIASSKVYQSYITK